MKLNYQIKYELNYELKILEKTNKDKTVIEVLKIILDENRPAKDIKMQIPRLLHLIENPSNVKPEVLWLLGLIYNIEHQDIQYDPQKTFYYSQLSAKQGYASAQVQLYKCLNQGVGCEINLSKSFDVLLEAVAQGNGKALYFLGCIYDDDKNKYGVESDPKKAFEYWSSALEKGWIPTITKLRYCYYRGKGVQEDKKKFIELSHKLLEEIPEAGLDSMIEYYQYGDAVPHDKKYAAELCFNILVHGYQFGDYEYFAPEYSIGILCQHYAYQEYVSREVARELNIWKAAVLLKKTTSHHDMVAAIRANKCLKKLIEDNKSLLEDFLKLKPQQCLEKFLAKEDFSKAATFYQYAFGTQQDLSKAAEFYRKAIQRGEPCYWDLYLCLKGLYELKRIDAETWLDFYDALETASKTVENPKLQKDATLCIAHQYEYGSHHRPKSILKAYEKYSHAFRIREIKPSRHESVKYYNLSLFTVFKESLSNALSEFPLVLVDLVLEYLFEPRNILDWEKFENALKQCLVEKDKYALPYPELALRRAAADGKLEVVKTLMETVLDLDINQKGVSGMNALMFSKKFKREKMVNFLKSKGASEEREVSSLYF